MTSERGNKPSASGFGILAGCLGQQTLVRTLTPEDLRRDSDDDTGAVRGDRIHAAMHKGSPDGLDDDERQDYEKCVKFRDSFLKSWLDSLPPEYQTMERKCFKEIRLWLMVDFEQVVSAQLDELWVVGDRGALWDFKTFWKHNTSSDKAWQLRVQVAVAAYNYDLKDCLAAFIRPKSRFEPIDATHFDSVAIQKTTTMVLTVIDRARNPDAPRTPGVGCRWCPAVRTGKCPEALSFALTPTQGVTLPMKKADAAGMVAAMPEERRFALQRVKSTITNILDANQAWLKAQPAEYLALHGFKLGQGRRTNPVDVKGAIPLLERIMPPLRVPECFEYVKGNAVKVVMDARKCSRAEAEKLLDETLATVTDKDERTAGSLEELSTP